ncbi:CYTH and CHAD domain-containing protein [Microvirga antarctica]|uniref:CYTH and CHAD domain-containing protein n=1 Tax=Microvirga antarctica TaxID=2819233 RepID=UPI001B311073|nr:CYTH and CHAD domain-containing protein [Microvirga antarctica]
MNISPKRDSAKPGRGAFRERELKLACEPVAFAHLMAHPLIAAAKPLRDKSGLLLATYFDTPEEDLRRAGIALRLRRRRGRTVQTIKATRARGLAFDRGEWESEVEGGLDFAAARGTPLRRILKSEMIRDRIQKRFAVETRRQAFLIETDGFAVECALDHAVVKAGRRSQPTTEIELELLRGEPEDLFRLARKLSKAGPLRLSLVAKSERGYRLLSAAGGHPVKAACPSVTKGTPSAPAFQAMAREALAQIIHNEELVRSFGDPEALHQMRVGFRRLKTLVGLFRPMLAGKQSKRIRKGLQWAARLSGPARDIDVLQQRAASGGLVSEHVAIADRRRAIYADLLWDLGRPRFGRVLLNTAVWIESGRWLSHAGNKTAAARAQPVEELTAKALSRRWKQIRRTLKHLDSLTPEARHKLRLRIKALRYGSEFVAGAFKGRQATRRRAALAIVLEGLQDSLGQLNDIVAGDRVLGRSADDDGNETASLRLGLMADSQRLAFRLRAMPPFWR